MRCWFRVVKLWFKYILKSPDKPFGELAAVWVRFEWQSEGAKGNKPHVHSGLSLVPGSEPKLRTMRRVDNHERHVFNKDNKTDYFSLIDRKLIKDREEYKQLRCLLEQMKSHNCQVGRCMKPAADGKRYCRYQRAVGAVEPGFKDITHFEKEETMRILEEIGLVNEDGSVVDILKSLKHYYCSGEGDVVNPFHGETSVILRCKHDAQACGGRFSVSYLCKYVAGPEEHKKVSLTAKDDAGHDVDVEREPFEHEKLKQCVLLAQQRRQNQGREEPLQREIASTEQTWKMCKLDYIITNKGFISINTKPRDKRAVVKKQSKYQIGGKLIDPQDNQLRLVKLRENSQRQFSANQIAMMHETLQSEFFPDKIVMFSMRCPENMMIDTVEHYIKYFVFSPCPKKELIFHENFNECPWIDGCGNRVKVSYAHLEDLVQYVTKRINQRDQHPLLRDMQQLLIQLINDKMISPPTDAAKRFVFHDTVQKIVVFPHTVPNDFNKFLIHLLYTQGRITTERDLFDTLSLRGAFQNAKLVADSDNVTIHEVRMIMKRFTVELLAFYPIGRRRFEHYLAVIWSGLKKYLLEHNDVNYLSIPAHTERAIQVEAEERLDELESKNINQLVNTLYVAPIRRLPERQDLLERRPCHFEPMLYQASENQSLESALEQQNAYQVCKNCVDSYLDPTTMMVYFPLLLGPPGVGKTHILLNVAVYCLSKTLKTVVTSFTAERARLLGGHHLHLLFSLPIEDPSTHILNSQSTADAACLVLAGQPEKMVFLQKMQVLMIEEISMINTHLFASIDNILRFVRSSNKPFGGVLLIASGDHRQLPPVQGTDIFLLTEMYTTFKVVCMEKFVRSHEDPLLQRLITHLRQPNMSNENINEVIQIFRGATMRPQYVSANQLPPNTLLVVSKKEAEQELIAKHVSKLKRIYGRNVVTIKAEDQIEQSPGIPKVTTDATVVRTLDYRCREPSQLVLHLRAVMRITYNNVVRRINYPIFSQGQLCIVERINSIGDNEPHTIQVRIVPPGQRRVDVDNIPQDWPPAILRKRQGEPIRSGSKIYIRKQFPLTYCVATTIHKVIGETVDLLAAHFGAEDTQHGMWDPKQLLVLISRVKTLRNFYITSSRPATVAAIKTLLAKRDERGLYVDEIINRLNMLKENNAIIEPPPPHIIGVESTLPAIDCGFFYILVSTKNIRWYDYGECINLNRLVNSINYSLIVDEYHADRRPYLLAAYVVGFPEEEHRNQQLRIELIESFSFFLSTIAQQDRHSEYIIRDYLPRVVRRFNGNRRGINIKIVRTIRFRGENDVPGPVNP